MSARSRGGERREGNVASRRSVVARVFVCGDARATRATRPHLEAFSRTERANELATGDESKKKKSPLADSFNRQRARLDLKGAKVPRARGSLRGRETLSGRNAPEREMHTVHPPVSDLILASSMLTRTQLARLDWPVLGWDRANARSAGISIFSRASWQNVRFSRIVRLTYHTKIFDASRFLKRSPVPPFYTTVSDVRGGHRASAAHTQSRASRPVRRRARTLTRERTIPSTRFGASRARNASQRHAVASETRALAAVAVVCISLTHSAIARLARDSRASRATHEPPREPPTRKHAREGQDFPLSGVARESTSRSRRPETFAVN